MNYNSTLMKQPLWRYQEATLPQHRHLHTVPSSPKWYLGKDPHLKETSKRRKLCEVPNNRFLCGNKINQCYMIYQSHRQGVWTGKPGPCKGMVYCHQKQKDMWLLHLWCLIYKHAWQHLRNQRLSHVLLQPWDQQSQPTKVSNMNKFNNVVNKMKKGNHFDLVILLAC